MASEGKRDYGMETKEILSHSGYRSRELTDGGSPDVNQSTVSPSVLSQ